MFWSVYTPEHEEMLRMIQSDEERAALIERLISDKFLIRRLLPEKFQNVTTIEVPERITGEQFCKMLHTLVPRISNE